VRSFVRRLTSIAALVLLDLSGLAIGVYAALVLRDLYRGNNPPLWGVLWKQETDWLPFLTVVTVLVFWQAGLYAPRERRAGLGRIVSGLVIVLLITMAFGIGTGQLEFSTFGFFPTALVLSIVLIGLLRASYEAITADVMRLAGVRRAVVLVGDGEGLGDLHRTLGSRRGGIDYDFLGIVSDSAGTEPSLPLLGGTGDLDGILAGLDADELAAQLPGRPRPGLELRLGSSEPRPRVVVTTPMIAAAAVVLLAGAFSGYAWRQVVADQRGASVLPSPSTVAGAAVTPGASPAVQARPIVVGVHVTETVWINAVVDGTPQYGDSGRTLPAGSVVYFTGLDVKITSGKASATLISIDGHNLGAMGVGVATREFSSQTSP